MPTRYEPCLGSCCTDRRRALVASLALSTVALAGIGTFKNVELTKASIRKNSPVLADMESSGAIKIAGAMYNLQSGVIDFFSA